MSIVDVNLVDEWSNTATNRPEIASSCCYNYVVDAIEQTVEDQCRPSFHDVARNTGCPLLSILILTVLILALRCPTANWQKNAHHKRVLVAKQTCPWLSSFEHFVRLSVSALR